MECPLGVNPESPRRVFLAAIHIGIACSVNDNQRVNVLDGPDCLFLGGNIKPTTAQADQLETGREDIHELRANHSLGTQNQNPLHLSHLRPTAVRGLVVFEVLSGLDLFPPVGSFPIPSNRIG